MCEEEMRVPTLVHHYLNVFLPVDLNPCHVEYFMNYTLLPKVDPTNLQSPQHKHVFQSE